MSLASSRLLPATLLIAALSGGCARSAPPAGELAVRWYGDVSPPADNVFRYNNGAEPETIDPGIASGQPDGRVARCLFEGLTVPDPRTLEPEPGQAHRWEMSADGLTYTFHLRHGLRWSDGTPLTARDFEWSWKRALRPETASRNASLLYPIRNAEAYNQGRLSDDAEVGVTALDDTTLVVTLESPTAYFLFLTQYYTYLPVPRHVVERHGTRWTRPEHLVGNGPFALDFWRQNDRFEFVPNPRYHDRRRVRLERVIAWSVDDLNTSLALYKTGVIDWNPSGYIPSPFIPEARRYADYRHGDYQAVYFYSVNVTRKPLDDRRVRRALSHAVDRESIARDLLKGSRRAWGNYTPTGYPGYQHPAPVTYEPARARALLAAAGYPDGRGFPKISILFNTSEDHRRIAEAVQAMWRSVLGIEVELSNQEWGSYLQATTSLDYDVARRSWIGDYLDPHTFLAMMRAGDGNNRTGWESASYEELLRRAARELDPARRFALLAEAEALLLEESPVIPIYHYSTNELVKPYVRGIYQTALDTHPLRDVWIDHDWKRRLATERR